MTYLSDITQITYSDGLAWVTVRTDDDTHTTTDTATLDAAQSLAAKAGLTTRTDRTDSTTWTRTDHR